MIYLPAHFSSDLKMVWKTTKRKPIIQAWCSSPPTSTCTRYPNYRSRSLYHPWEHFGHSGSAFWASNVNMLLRHPILTYPICLQCWLGCCYCICSSIYGIFGYLCVSIDTSLHYKYFITQSAITSDWFSQGCEFNSQGFRGPLQLPPTAWAVNLYRKSGLQFCYRKYQHGQHGMHEIAWVHLCSVFGLRLFPRHVDAFCLIFKTCWNARKVFQAWSESKRSRWFRLRIGCCK